MSNRELKKLFAKKQDVLYTLPAVLGNADGVVLVGSKPGYVYVSIDDITMTVYNARVTPQPGLPVFIGYEASNPNLLQVLSIRASDTQYGGAAAHHWQHEFPSGSDIVWVQLRQFMPLRVTPIGGMKIAVYRTVGHTAGGYKVIEGEEIDLSSHRPISDNKACFVLITVDIDGVIQVTKGTEVNRDSLELSNIPEMPVGTAWVIGAIRLYTLQTEIREAATDTDIIDMRFPMRHTHKLTEIEQGHAPVTVADSTTIDFTLTGQQLTADVKLSNIPLDSLGTPNDTTNLDVSASRHGLCPKLPGSTGVYLRGDGTWATPPGSGGGGVAMEELDGTPSVSNVTMIRVSNGTLIDDGNGVVRLATGGGSMDVLAIQVFS